MKRPTIGLGIAVIIFILLCTVACGGGDGPLAKGGINMIVVSGKARIQADEGDTSVMEGQEAVITAGDQIMADEAGVKLLLVDGSLLDLKPDTELQVVTFSAEGTTKLRQLKGRLEVEAASPLLTIEISTSSSEGFALKTMHFTATPAVRETAFGLWIDGLNAHLTVEAGGVNVTNDDRTGTIPAGSKVQASPNGKLIVSSTGPSVEPTVVVLATDDLTPTPTATPIATATSEYLLYPAPGLQGPGDGDDFEPNDDILLMWDTSTSLAEDAWYEVQLWREGEPPDVVQWVKEGTWKVEPEYYPGRYQWRILIVRGQEGRKERDLSPPSQTWSFSWLRPVSVPTAATTSPPSDVSVDLTVYLRGTRTGTGFAALSDDRVYGWEIYEQGQCVYGDAAVQIGEMTYHFDDESGVDEQLPDLWQVEFGFAKELKDHTTTAKGDRCAKGAPPGFNPKKAWFWVGILDDSSAVGEDNPYSLTMKLYKGDKLRKSIQVFFTVADAPESPGRRREEPTPPIRE
jgi:hypothetical protein